MDVRQLCSLGLIAVACVVTAHDARADSGSTLTPDRLTFMVNKDVGAERWTINLNLTPDAPQRILNVSGNIFRADGAPPSFVLCQVRPDSTGSLDDPSSTFRLSCTGSDPCTDSALSCSQREWRPVDADVPVPAAFFLPPGGRVAVAASIGSSLARGAEAGESSRGATLSSDGYSFLVNKDVGKERWSISLNLVPIRRPDGTFETRFSSVTGNVFQPDGSPPSFIYCTQRPEASGTIADRDSEFQLSCFGTNACATTAEACANSSWQPIAGDVALPASFFLPPAGLPDATSDPEIVVIGRTSDPPSIVTRDFRLLDGGSALGDRTLGASCATGKACLATRIGSCPDVPGTVVENDFCGCKVTDVPADCITCGAGSSGTCGDACAFAVGSGSATARGFCLPFAAGTPDCLCYAVPASGEPTAPACGGPVGGGCPADLCCADDPRDGCTGSSGGLDCAGVCIDAGGCDPQVEQCGLCLPPTPTPTPTATRTPTPTDTPTETPCGNGTRDAGEECDGDDFGGDSCSARGFCGGQLSCDECRISDATCSGGGGLPEGASCSSSTCCASGLCSATRDAPGEGRCISCPKLGDECTEADCCDQFGQLECRAAAGSSFCCVGSGFACAGDDECCDGSCQAGACQ